MTHQTLIFQEPVPGLAEVSLNRPEMHNAINWAMVEELETLLNTLQKSASVRVMILTGAGSDFSSGADLRDPRVMSPCRQGALAHLEQTQRRFTGLVLQMSRLPQPVITAVNGPALGAGLGLALAGDIIIASTRAAFTASYINVGLSGGEMGSSYLLPRMVGLPRAMDILLTGRTIGAEEAERIGLISRLVEPEALMAEARKTARIMLAKSSAGLRMTKESVRMNLSAAGLEAAGAFEDRNQSLCTQQPESLALLARTLERISNSS